MGTWGHKPLDNDAASDLLGDFNDSKDIAVLENSLDAVCELKDSDFLDAPTAEQAVAAASILKESGEIKPEDKARLTEKVTSALKRVLEKSELKDLWQESGEHDEWAKSVQELV
jgi:gamma-glutamyl:cysteine ligase YbdK (ATP-grasp superfamily)